ncbi:CRTAC1 family protein [Tundrisphaera sp. TA3]|uniref:CRTAC1 family protein n=1 Tax=Tundrisphaera sp. TA3 TaxID=3435775 RepID=UPI003EBFE75E
MPALVIAWAAACGCDGTAEPGPEAGVAPPPATVAGPTAGPAPRPASTITGDREAHYKAEPANPTIPQEVSPFRFAEVAAASGIDFRHVSGMTEAKHFPTANGSGVAFLDYDGDGKLDLYFVTATTLPLGSSSGGTNRLYRNMGDGKFEDRTGPSGLGFSGFCHGIVVGDIDNDGDPDVFLCNYGPNALYLNRGDGTFEDISHASKIDVPGWSSGGAFFDYDGDGDLDLYVANYGIWNLPEDDRFCGDREKNVRLYCSPREIRTTKHFLYRNNGDRTFTDVYDQFLVDASGNPIPGRDDGHGFAAVAADVDDDGRADLYVANDMNPNFLFLNKGGGKFEDATDSSNAAYDEKGHVQSGMGVDAEDIDGDGDPELFVTNFAHEYNTLYQNRGGGNFLDMTPFSGMGADSRPWVGWGTALADFDNDGWPDCFVANGHVDDNRRALGQNVDYAEPPLLHRNANGKRFRLATRDVGPYFSGVHVARGAAFGDFDDDGDIDIAVSHKDGPAALLRNDTPAQGHWIRLELTGTKSNRDAIGATIRVEAGGRTIVRQRKHGSSVFSSHDPRMLIGVGDAAEVDKLSIRWPSGATTVRERVAVDATLAVVEGE